MQCHAHLFQRKRLTFHLFHGDFGRHYITYLQHNDYGYKYNIIPDCITHNSEDIHITLARPIRLIIEYILLVNFPENTYLVLPFIRSIVWIIQISDSR